MNRTIWHQIVAGSGVEIAERNGRLEIAFRADALAGGDGLQAQSTNEWFGDQPVRIAFDNFVITAERPVC